MGLPAVLAVMPLANTMPAWMRTALASALLVYPAALLVYQVACLADGRQASTAELRAALARRWAPLLLAAAALAVARWLPQAAPNATLAVAARACVLLALIRFAFVLPVVALERRALAASVGAAWSAGRGRWPRVLLAAAVYGGAYLLLARGLGGWGNTAAAAVLLVSTGVLSGLFIMTLTLEFRDAVPAHGAANPPALAEWPAPPAEAPAETPAVPEATARLEEFGALPDAGGEAGCR
jgi:hypothetical protein